MKRFKPITNQIFSIDSVFLQEKGLCKTFAKDGECFGTPASKHREEASKSVEEISPKPRERTNFRTKKAPFGPRSSIPTKRVTHNTYSHP